MHEKIDINFIASKSGVSKGTVSRVLNKSNLVKSSTKEQTENLLYLKELIEAGKIKSVIDRRYPLAQTAEAHRYAETGHKNGNVVITFDYI